MPTVPPRLLSLPTASPRRRPPRLVAVTAALGLLGAAAAAAAPAPAAGAIAVSAAAPTVRLGTPPWTGAAGVVRGPVQLSATAAARPGIAKVVFLANNKRIGEDTSAPYRVSWDTRRWADGRYGVRALAISRSGTVAYSTTTTMTAGNSAPRVSFAAPASAGVAGLVAGTVPLSAGASHAAGIAAVQFFLDGRRIGADSVAPYALAWDTRRAADGRHYVQVRVVSRAGTTAVSPRRPVTVGNSAPRVAIARPPGGPVAGPVTLSATAAHPAGIRTVIFLANNKRIGEDATAPYTVSWNTSAWADRRYGVRALAISRTGTTAYTAVTTVAVDNSRNRWGDWMGTWAAPRQGIFGPASVWKQTVRSAPVAANSAAVVADLAGQVARRSGGVASLNVWQYTAQVATASPQTPRVTVHWDNCQRKGYTPRGLFGPGGQFASVPVPGGAVPSTGSDSSLSIWSPSADQFWSFWKMNRRPDGWHACWGGRIDHVSTSPGYFTGGFGASATGTAGIGGMLSMRDVEYGRADHAIAFGIINPASWKTFSWPAQRSDGSPGSTGLVMEGQRFRLDPRVDVDALPLSRIGRIVAHAAQDHGMIVTDKSGVVAIGAESGTMVQRATGRNPWPGYLAGPKGMDRSYDVLAGFPWNRLQALPRDYGKATG